MINAVSMQAVGSSGVSLLTLLIRDSLCFVLEVAPVALVEAPLLLFSFNLRTTEERQDVSRMTLEEAGWPHSGLHHESRSISSARGQKHEHSVSLRVCMATRCKCVSACLPPGPPDGRMDSWTEAQ